MTTRMLEHLDDNRAAVNFISLDFQKAFNRMDHEVCLNSLASRGASSQTLRIVSCFLRDRSMRIKLGEIFSTKRSTPGGAPQGTKAGNFLFCAAVDGIEEQGYIERVRPAYNPPEIEEEPATSPAAVPGQRILTVDQETIDTISRYGVAASADDSLGLRDLHSRIQRDFSTDSAVGCAPSRTSSISTVVFEGDSRKNRRHQRIDDLDSETEDNGPTQELLTEASGLPPRWREAPLEVRQFIDDISAGEKLAIMTGVMSLSEKKTTYRHSRGQMPTILRPSVS